MAQKKPTMLIYNYIRQYDTTPSCSLRNLGTLRVDIIRSFLHMIKLYHLQRKTVFGAMWIFDKALSAGIHISHNTAITTSALTTTATTAATITTTTTTTPATLPDTCCTSSNSDSIQSTDAAAQKVWNVALASFLLAIKYEEVNDMTGCLMEDIEEGKPWMARCLVTDVLSAERTICTLLRGHYNYAHVAASISIALNILWPVAEVPSATLPWAYVRTLPTSTIVSDVHGSMLMWTLFHAATERALKCLLHVEDIVGTFCFSEIAAACIFIEWEKVETATRENQHSQKDAAGFHSSDKSTSPPSMNVVRDGLFATFAAPTFWVLSNLSFNHIILLF